MSIEPKKFIERFWSYNFSYDFEATFLILRESWSSLIILAKPEIEKTKWERVLYKVT